MRVCFGSTGGLHPAPLRLGSFGVQNVQLHTEAEEYQQLELEDQRLRHSDVRQLSS